MSKIKNITVRADKNIKIALAIKGWPVLIVNWQHSDKDIYKDDCNNIETNNDQALLVVKDATRRHRTLHCHSQEPVGLS